MSVETALFGIIGKQLGIGTDEISYKSNFMDDLGADSLDTIEIVMSIEEEFDIEIPDNEVEEMYTVGSVLNYLNANLSNG
jgi:acyl carrier protein